MEAVCKLEQFSLILKWKVVFLFSQAEKNENLTLNSISSKCFECIFSQSEILDFQHFLWEHALEGPKNTSESQNGKDFF